MRNKDILKTVDLKKIYNGVPVVNNINIEISSGQIIGLLGRNGAGKTTTFLMLSGMIKPDFGEVFLKVSNSAEVTLKIMASSVEHSAEIPMVSDIATISSPLMPFGQRSLMLSLRG